MEYKTLKRQFAAIALSILALFMVDAARADWGIFFKNPEIVDPFKDILDPAMLGAASGPKIERASELSVAVILSDNTRRHMEWTSTQTKGGTGVEGAMAAMFAGAQNEKLKTLHQLTYDPKLVTDGTMVPMSEHFRSVQIVNSFEEFRAGEFDLLVVLDISFVNRIREGFRKTKGDEGMYVKAFFIDRQNSLAGRVTAGSVITPNHEDVWEVMPQVRAHKLQVLAEFARGLNALLGPAGAAAPAMAPILLPAQTMPSLPVGAPAKSGIQQCIDACRSNTSRTAEQCFDSCNHPR
ncbi:MAG: hypothetical protein RLZZ200_624 [Pseudomonadota bacterium]|jgi:hypothetical protein